MRPARPSFRAAAGEIRGAAIIEFAIIAPVMVLLMCGLSDIALTIYSRLQATNTAQAAADLATQNSQLRSSDLADIYNASYALMRPLSTGPITLRITNVYSDGNGYAWVYWSCGQGSLSALPAKSGVTTTATGDPVDNLLFLTTSGRNTSYIRVEANYAFTPPTGFVLKTTQVTTAVAYSLPRLSTYVGFPWDGVVGHTTTVPTSALVTSSVSTSAGGKTIACNYAT